MSQNSHRVTVGWQHLKMRASSIGTRFVNTEEAAVQMRRHRSTGQFSGTKQQ